MNGFSYWVGTMPRAAVTVTWERVEATLNDIWAMRYSDVSLGRLPYYVESAVEQFDKTKPERWFDCFRTPAPVYAEIRPVERLNRLRRGQSRVDPLQSRRHKRKRFLIALRN